MGDVMEISVSLLIFMIGIIIAGKREKAKKKKTGTGKKGPKSTSGSSLISKKQGGQSKVKTARASARPNIPDKKRNKTTKKIPAHLALQEEAITGHSGYIKQDNYRGKRSVATRLMEGDPVPEGYLGISCHYCGAVNLVKKNSRAKHSCYFCREPID